MLNEINYLLSKAEVKDLRPGTFGIDAYMDDLDEVVANVDFSRYSNALKASANYRIGFLRASNVKKSIIIQDPKQYHRKPLCTVGYHEFYIDNSPYWEDYPNRYNSLMFLSIDYEEYYNGRYGEISIYGEEHYFVFPENDCTIAISSTEDFINSFNNNLLVDELYDLNINIRRLYIDVVGEDLCANNAAQWEADLVNMQRKFNSMNDEEKRKIYDHSMMFIMSDLRIKNKWKFLTDVIGKERLSEFIKDKTNPDKNGFRLTKMSKNLMLSEHRECWTDGTCLMINEKDFEDLLEARLW